MPPAANASSSRITETVGPARVQPRRNSPAVPAPARAKVLRTRVGDPPVGDPTENYRGSRVAQVSQPANFRHRTHRKVALTHQIKWQPGDLEVQHVVCAEQAPAGSPTSIVASGVREILLFSLAGAVGKCERRTFLSVRVSSSVRISWFP